MDYSIFTVRETHLKFPEALRSSMIEKLTVKIGEQILTEGKEFSFSRSIENLCGSFEITCKTGEFEEGEGVSDRLGFFDTM